jgi:hypothetical protein
VRRNSSTKKKGKRGIEKTLAGIAALYSHRVMGRTAHRDSIYSNKLESHNPGGRESQQHPPTPSHRFYRSHKATWNSSYFVAAHKRIWQLYPLRESFQTLLLSKSTDWSHSNGKAGHVKHYELINRITYWMLLTIFGNIISRIKCCNLLHFMIYLTMLCQLQSRIRRSRKIII